MPPRRGRSARARRGNQEEPVNEPEPYDAPQFQNAVGRVIRDTLPTIIAEVMQAAGLTNNGHNENERHNDDNADNNVNNGNVNQPEVEVATIGEPARGCSYKTFKGCDPPTFNGKRDAMATFQWIHEMEAVVEISGCTVNQAVLYAAHSFRAEALFWWDNVKISKGREAITAMTWNMLKEMVLGKFCPTIEKDRLEREFLQLQAGTMTHRQFVTKFDELARLLPEHVDTEEKRVKRFVQALPPRIRQLVKMSDPKTYESAVTSSAIAYEEEDLVTNEKKRKRDKEEGIPEKKQKHEGKEEPQKTYPKCVTCGKLHQGKCWLRHCSNCKKTGHPLSECPEPRKCFKCGDPKHLRSECPQLKKDS